MFRTRTTVDIDTLLTPEEPSFEDRYNGAAAVAGFARLSFLNAADDLDETADNLASLATDVQDEIDRLNDLLVVVSDESSDARNAARNLRGLVAPALSLF